MMKKITTIFSMLLFVAINAQVYYSEDFTSSTTGSAPTGVTVLNQDACTVNAPQIYTNGTFITLEDGGNKYAQAQSWTVPPCQVNNWLITPTIDLSTASASVGLKWRYKTNAAFSETYEVRVSTTGAAVADFTTLLQTYTVAAGAFTPSSLNLAAFAGQTIRIAFRQTSTDEDVLAIDDIEVSEPPQYDLEISSVTTNARTYTTNLTQNPLPVRVLDFSKRTSFEASVEITNSGVSAADSIILTYFLVDDLNAPNLGVVFVDTILTTLASGASYIHTFEAFGIDTLFPSLFEDQVLDFYVQIDSSFNNRTLDNNDFVYSFLVAPTESYAVPFETSFEVAFGNSFNFNHREWGWKYLDNNNDGNTLAPGSFSNLPAQDGDWQIIGSIVGGNNLSLAANNDFLQSPEFTLETGKTYQASIWARTGFGATGTVAAFLTNSTSSINLNLGPIALVAADSTYKKFTFTFSPTVTAADYMFDFRKTTNGFIMLDLFEVNELVAPTVSVALVNSSLIPGGGVEYCDSTVTIQYSVTGPPASLVINWGDGNTTTINNPATSGQSSHSYATLSTFNITATATNVVASATSTPISVEIAASPTYEANFTTVINGGAVTIVDASTPAAGQRCSSSTFTWSFGDGSANVVHAGNAPPPGTYTYSAPGTYTIALIIQSPGVAPSVFQVEVTITGVPGVNINEVNFAQALNIFPNPTSEVVNISFELNKMQNVELSVISIDGKVLAVNNLENALNVNTNFNVSNFNNGVYFIRIKTEEGISTQRFVISKK